MSSLRCRSLVEEPRVFALAEGASRRSGICSAAGWASVENSNGGRSPCALRCGNLAQASPDSVYELIGLRLC
jgi:hypothetical protein